ncbi:MAG: gliding motility-associated C-terminal domain-containing protein [Chitinophagaceae bacterium]|nr:gliding motility-associated C-terminal domain-containing protein [Chitinophagaceae bacterium]MCW5926354.1 gliding motility-associated C-terminal domain-containing protein [Chitinophagaceae bacterium]
MRLKYFTIFLLFVSDYIYAQTCTTLGQTPATAFPVCGTSVFSQTTVPACGGKSIPVPGCNDGAAYGDLNPFWYKFTCFSSGTLGLTITPMTQSDDYDWQIFDITGRNPNDVYTDGSLYITSNWSAVSGATGTASNATAATNCAGYDYPNKSRMPFLLEGRQYLLLVSHFTSTNQSGYTLRFEGGTASITDPKAPHTSAARAFCDGSTILLKLNKKMRCNTLAPDGSDFSISSGLATIVGAGALTCATGFEMDSVAITLSNPLPPGSYSLFVKTGSDGNTIMDHCDREIPNGERIDFTLEPVQPTPMDSLSPVSCAPDLLQLVFEKPMRCSSIAPDGSDFVITGPTPVSVSAAYGKCSQNDNSEVIYIKLSSPILTKGSYTISLVRGTDGNTIIDECGEETPMGENISFQTADTVDASFSHQILYGCELDTIIYTHPGGNDIHTWQWAFEDGSTYTDHHTEKIYSVFGEKNASLVVSNGVCSDTVSTVVVLDNELKAAFDAIGFICPEDSIAYKDRSIGRITDWYWEFGNGSTSRLQHPDNLRYAPPHTNQIYTVSLTVTDDIGCVDAITKEVTVVTSCYIAIPNAFTPNGDGLNDFLYPVNAYKADNLIFRVFNVYGQKVFETRDHTKKWDGTLKNVPQQSGAYVWTLEYTHRDTGRNFDLKGTTMLIR